MDGSADDGILKLYPQKERIQVRSVVRRCASKCMQHLAEKDIEHRDLRTRNVFYKIKDNTIIFKVGDFGESRFLGNGDRRDELPPFERELEKESAGLKRRRSTDEKENSINNLKPISTPPKAAKGSSTQRCRPLSASDD